MGDLTITPEHRDGVTILHVEGAVDVYTAPRLRVQVKAAAEAGRLVVSLGDCWLMDSTGPGVLVGALKVAREHGNDLVIACSDERILNAFRVTGLTKVFRIFDDADEAVAALAARATGER